MASFRMNRRAALAGAGALLAQPRLVLGQGDAPAVIGSDAARPRAE